MEKSSEELLWAIKNGELSIVKDVVEKQVRLFDLTSWPLLCYSMCEPIPYRILMSTMRLLLDIRYITLPIMDKLMFSTIY